MKVTFRRRLPRNSALAASRSKARRDDYGKTVPTSGVISSLARELDSDVRYLTKLAAEIKPT